MYEHLGLTRALHHARETREVVEARRLERDRNVLVAKAQLAHALGFVGERVRLTQEPKGDHPLEAPSPELGQHGFTRLTRGGKTLANGQKMDDFFQHRGVASIARPRGAPSAGILQVMNRDELKARQAPLKERYREAPAAALVTLSARGELGEGLSCGVETGRALVRAGLHPATGGTGELACSGDLLLQALVACAGVTLSAVATSMGLAVRAGTLVAEGDLDFRGTLGVDKEAPVGFAAIRLSVELDTDATPEQVEKLLQLTERYCVVLQTLSRPTPVTLARRSTNQHEENP